MSPLQSYQKKLNTNEIKQDALQLEVVLGFEDLYLQLQKDSNLWFFQPRPKFKGMYIYGSVGRGKTFLMDLFVETINKDKILRQHFHGFMLWFHQQLHSLKKQQNPIDLVIKKLSKQISVLCLDEFLVNDITDAMILSRILLALNKHHISLVTTSNINPQELYLGGLQRQRFLPAINWIQKHMHVIQLDGNYDFRKSTIQNNNKWLTPINNYNQNIFEQTFSQLTGDDNLHLSSIEINKRPMSVIKRCRKHIMFEFDILCKQARNASDYIKLAQKYKSIFIVIDAKIENDDRNTAKRFITLIDVLYDNKTSLYVLSQFSIEHIYQGQELAFEMKRTLSRLTEMT
jgi:cell division protein ZapE